MRAIHVLPGAFLALALLGAGASVASAADEPAPACSVTVERSGATDSLTVSKQVLDGGACVCYISTGPASQSEVIEKKIVEIQGTGKCGEYKDWGTYLLAAGAVAGGIAAANHDNSDSGSGDNDSTGG